MSQHIHYVTDANFDEEVLQSAIPVLVDYWAEWCGPCKMIAPILDEIASEYGDRLKVAKLNIDENQITPPKYGIRGIPTLMLFKKMEVLKQPKWAHYLSHNSQHLLTVIFKLVNLTGKISGSCNF